MVSVVVVVVVVFVVLMLIFYEQRSLKPLVPEMYFKEIASIL